jgi:hypothetical protein
MAPKGNPVMNDLPSSNEFIMPRRRSLLSIEQRTRLFAIPVDHAEMAKHYVRVPDDGPFPRTFVTESNA